MDSPQNEHISEHQIPENTNEEDKEKEHNAEKEDPTIDEYHNMKEKREDDNSGPKSVSETCTLISSLIRNYTWSKNSEQAAPDLSRC